MRHSLGQRVVVHGQEAADVGQAVLLGAHRAAVGEGGHLAHDVGDRPVGLPGLALLDEPGVLGEAAGVEEQRHAVRVHSSRTARRLASETGCPPPELLVIVTNTTGMRSRRAREQRLQRLEVHVALEGVAGRRRAALGDDQVDRLGAR